ncbi:hypothetical protein BDM02DRAFT_2330783 [Thelephora ganbajun]|uniref:Uncharacterized protein n=1 Tax=Thelephora ganbajun TaxID=370292 RepID=A0ACB6ZF78_THEGA|nr:hypothetical protein BDM02DRAFT_2330783 [Thelephora ganbajun]
MHVQLPFLRHLTSQSSCSLHPTIQVPFTLHTVSHKRNAELRCMINGRKAPHVHLKQCHILNESVARDGGPTETGEGSIGKQRCGSLASTGSSSVVQTEHTTALTPFRFASLVRDFTAVDGIHDFRNSFSLQHVFVPISTTRTCDLRLPVGRATWEASQCVLGPTAIMSVPERDEMSSGVLSSPDFSLMTSLSPSFSLRTLKVHCLLIPGCLVLM